MYRGRIGDVAVGAVGDVAGAVVDPKRGIQQLRSKAMAPAVIGAVLALVVGYLFGRRLRH